MKYIDPDIARWVINDHIATELKGAEAARRARIAQAAGGSLSLRRRAGGAVIAFGERLAGERRPMKAGSRLAAGI